MDDKITKETLEKYSGEVLNWLPAMSNDEKANFLHHMETYGSKDKITFDRLSNGEYLPHLISERKENLQRLRLFICGDVLFTLWSMVSLTNNKDIAKLIYDSELEKQILLATGQVLPPLFTIACALMTLDFWYHYSLCNDTLNKYQRLLKK